MVFSMWSSFVHALYKWSQVNWNGIIWFVALRIPNLMIMTSMSMQLLSNTNVPCYFYRIYVLPNEESYPLIMMKWSMHVIITLWLARMSYQNPTPMLYHHPFWECFSTSQVLCSACYIREILAKPRYIPFDGSQNLHCMSNPHAASDQVIRSSAYCVHG